MELVREQTTLVTLDEPFPTTSKSTKLFDHPHEDVAATPVDDKELIVLYSRERDKSPKIAFTRDRSLDNRSIRSWFSKRLKSRRRQGSSTPATDDKTTEIEYKRLVRELLAGKELELEEIKMCRDKIELLSESVCSLTKITEEVKWCLEASWNHIYHHRPGQLEWNNAYFFQLLYKSLDVWICDKSLFKRKFVLTNGELVKKTQELETAMRAVLLLFLQRQRELKTLDHALKIHPEIVKFRQRVPFKRFEPSETSHLETRPDDGEEDFENDRVDSHDQEELLIKFVDSEMQFLVTKTENGGSRTSQIVLLKDLADDCQAEIICIPIRQQIRSITKAIYNIRMAQGHLESLRINELWEIIIPPSIKVPFFNSLENVVLAILVNSASGAVYSITPILMELESGVRDVTWFLRLLQRQAEGKRLIEKESKQVTWEEVFSLEAIEKLLKEEQIPEEFEIWEKPIKREFSSTIYKDLKITPEINRNLENVMTRPKAHE